MRITIVPDDTYCSIDGLGFNTVDMSSLDSTIHAIQWYDIEGEVEYREQEGYKPPNAKIYDTALFDGVIASWNQVKYEHDNPPPPPPPTAEQNKKTAERKLASTDWAVLPDVNISNKDAFIEYRAILREYVLNPVAGNIDWPNEPSPVWLT